eukprot:COSAG04_NODE_92_length_26689_cov_12.755434_8_plen_495_part_00
MELAVGAVGSVLEGVEDRTDGGREGVVTNPLALEQGQPSDRQTRRLLAQDSNEAASEIFAEQLVMGRLLQNPAVYRAMQLFVVGCAVASAILPTKFQRKAGMAAPNELLWVTATCVACAVFCSLLPLRDARVALAPGGALEALGAGSTKLTSSQIRSIRRWRRALGLPIFMGGTAGFFNFVFPFCNWLGYGCGTEYGEVMSAEDTAALWGQSFFPAMVVPVLLYGWLVSFRTASALCRDAATEIIKDVAQDGSDKDEEHWESRVTQPAMALNSRLTLLTEGWGQGLEGIFLASLSGALGATSLVLNDDFATGSYEHKLNLEVEATGLSRQELMRNPTSALAFAKQQHLVISFIALLLAAIPLAVAADVAQTSTRCDQLLNVLNDKRNAANHEQITWLEHKLLRYHNGQGLGFKAFGTVVDQKTLKNWAIALGGALSTILTFFIALGQGSHPIVQAAGPACGLTAVEAERVRAAMLGHNASCTYNISLASILRAE